MGIFSKITDNFKHGGVDVHLQAPASVSLQDASFVASVNITAKDTSQTIKHVRVEVVGEPHNQSFNTSSTGQNYIRKVMARAEYAEPFALQAGETKTIQLNIVMNSGAAAVGQMEEQNNLAGSIAQAVQGLQTVANALNADSYTYRVEATADVDGIAFDPSDHQPIQILKPGQIGTGFNIGL